MFHVSSVTEALGYLFSKHVLCRVVSIKVPFTRKEHSCNILISEIYNYNLYSTTTLNLWPPHSLLHCTRWYYYMYYYHILTDQFSCFSLHFSLIMRLKCYLNHIFSAPKVVVLPRFYYIWKVTITTNLFNWIWHVQILHTCTSCQSINLDFTCLMYDFMKRTGYKNKKRAYIIFFLFC